MPRYSRFEHDAALSVLMEAAAFGAEVSDSDTVMLNRVCGSYLSGTADNVSFNAYESALHRVRQQILLAKSADPARAERVMAHYAAKAAATEQDKATTTASADARTPRAGCRSQGLTHERRAAERMAIVLGHRDRQGHEYGSPSRRQNILNYAEAQ